MNLKPFHEMISDIFCKMGAPYKKKITPRPLHEAIHDICGRKVIRFDEKKWKDATLKKAIERACKDAYHDLKNDPITASRPNEVGNKIEPRVIKSLNKLKNYTASVPCGQPTGYPDILLKAPDGRYTYIECKTYKNTNIDTNFRSFYFSPSETFKVEHDARHLVVAFEMVKTGQEKYRAAGFKMVDAYNLPCTLKLEWNSNNKLLYELPLLLEYHE